MKWKRKTLKRYPYPCKGPYNAVFVLFPMEKSNSSPITCLLTLVLAVSSTSTARSGFRLLNKLDEDDEFESAKSKCWAVAVAVEPSPIIVPLVVPLPVPTLCPW